MPRALTATLGVAVIVGASACKRDAPPAPPAAAAPPAPKPAPAPAAGIPAPPPSADERAAAAWLDALRERDPGAVLDKMKLPFDFRDAHPDARSKKCASRVATARAAATLVATCLAKDERLHAELSATPEPRIVAIGSTELPPWAKAWAGAVPAGTRALSTFVHGEADARELVLLVGDDGVHGVWQSLTIEPR